MKLSHKGIIYGYRFTSKSPRHRNSSFGRFLIRMAVYDVLNGKNELAKESQTWNPKSQNSNSNQ